MKIPNRIRYFSSSRVGEGRRIRRVREFVARIEHDHRRRRLRSQRRRAGGLPVKRLVKDLGPGKLEFGFAYVWRLPVTNILVSYFFTEARGGRKARAVLKIYFAGGKKTKAFDLLDPVQEHFADCLIEQLLKP